MNSRLEHYTYRELVSDVALPVAMESMYCGF